MTAELAELAGRRVAILRPEPAAPVYELRDGRRVLARMHRRSRTSRVMLAEASDGRWTFRVAGIPYPRYTAEDDPARPAAALLDTATETLTLRDGRTLRWTSAELAGWWALTADPDLELLRFHERVSGRRRGELEIDARAMPAPEVLSLLALLGTYRIILEAEAPAAPSRAAR